MKSHLEKTCFFDEEQEIARYDVVKYPQIEKLVSKHLGFFWRPEEVHLGGDSKDFNYDLTKHEQHIFISNIQRQIVLDTKQGKAPSTVLLDITSLPEIESFIVWWTAFENLHSRSYTHILRKVFTDPSKVFDNILNIKEIVDCAKDISKQYDLLKIMNHDRENGYAHTKLISDNPVYDHKKALWMCLNSINALEGVRFYASFACSWAFAEVGKMEGNAKIIKFIARDENVHLAFTQQILKILPLDDPDFAKIKKECEPLVLKMFMDVIAQEKTWCRYLFKDGSIIGLNETLLANYVEWIAAKRMTAIGVNHEFTIKSNPLPWTQKWISGADVQLAPQETEITSYIQGGTKKDMEDALSGLSL